MLKRITALFIGWKIIILIFALLASFLIKLNIKPWLGLPYGDEAPYLFWVWANFDGIHYLHIVRHGYTFPNFAFFPLLPFLIFLVNKLTSLPIFQSSWLITNLFFFLSLFVFYKIVLLDFEEKVAWRAIILLLIFPVSFFYGAIYTESLFFLLATLSFYYARKAHWALAGFFGYFAALSRLVGISLFLALLLEWFLQNRLKIKEIRNLLFLGLIPLGLITYGVYLQLYFGDFFLFQKSMAPWGQGNFIFPLQTLFRYLKIILFAPKNIVYFVAVLELIATFFYFFLSFYVLKKIRISYGVWMLISLLIPTFTGTLQSMPRYILHLFPAFIALSLITQRPKWFFLLTVLVFLILQFILVTLFTRGYFVA